MHFIRGLWIGMFFLVQICFTTVAEQSRFSWSNLPPLPVTTGLEGAFAGTSGRHLIVAGGVESVSDSPSKSPLVRNEIFLLDLDQIEKGWRKSETVIPAAIGHGVSIQLTEGVLCVSGGDSHKNFKSVFLLTVQDRSLQVSLFPELPIPLAHVCGDRVGNKVYIAGGRFAPDTNETSSEFLCLDLEDLGGGW